MVLKVLGDTMKQYTFFSRDYFSNSGNFSIAGDHFVVLMNYCFQYSSYLSFRTSQPDNRIIHELKKCQIESSEIGCELENKHDRIFCNTSKEVYNTLMLCSSILLEDGYFRPAGYPEDIIFYRQDGSIFFEAINHEGEYSLFVSSEENVDAILKFGHWLAFDAFGKPEAPACEHQLPPPVPQSCILSDGLYLMLQEMRATSEKHIRSLTIQEVLQYAEDYKPQGYHSLPSSIKAVCSFLPVWYIAFKLFVLGELNAMTNDTILEALEKAGYSGTDGFIKFYELLDRYVTEICST